MSAAVDVSLRRRKATILIICSSSLFLTYLDATILNVALPSIQHSMHGSVSGLQWVVDSYLLVVASGLIFAGSIGDRFGRRRVFTTGLLTFGAGSLLCSLSPNIGSLIAARVLQALGGTMLSPASLSIVRQTFQDPRERARAFGVWSAVFGLAGCFGPVIGGLLVGSVGWRSVFWVNVPIAAAAFLLARTFVPESKMAHPRRLDPLGQALIAVSLGTLTFATIEGPLHGWHSTLIVTLYTVAALAMLAFIAFEMQHDEPLLDVRFFRSAPFSGAVAIAIFSFVVLAGFLFVNTLYLQDVRGYTPAEAGIATLPCALGVVAAAPIAGYVMSHVGPRVPLLVSGLALTAGGVMLTAMRSDTPYLELAIAYAFIGIGQGLVNPPITNAAMSGMPAHRAGVASAVASTSRQFGNILGVAVMGAMLTGALASRFGGSVYLRGADAGDLSGVLARAKSQAGARREFDDIFAASTHSAWVLAAACGVAVVLVSVVTMGTAARNRAIAIAELVS